METGYIVLIYLALGFVVMGWLVPNYLKKKEANLEDDRSLGWFAESLLIYSSAPLIILGIFTWPVLAPLWVWMRLSAKKEKEEFLRGQKEEEERKKIDPNYGLSMEQKIEKLRELSES